jgi:hypothetical protein
LTYTEINRQTDTDDIDTDRLIQTDIQTEKKIHRLTSTYQQT